MMCEIQAAGMVELFFYGELPPQERARMHVHLKQCGICRQALDDMAAIREALGSRPPITAPLDGDWSRLMSRLDLATSPPRAAHGRHIIAYLALAATLALITAATLSVLRLSDGTEVPAAPSVTATAQPPSDMPRQPDAALLSISESHFERSKLVVLGLATDDAVTIRPGNWPRQRELAATLLNDTRLYRLAAEERGMTTLAGVMRDLELVLLQTSMSADEADPDAIAQLQRLIRRRDLLTKMNMVTAGGP